MDVRTYVRPRFYQPTTLAINSGIRKLYGNYCFFGNARLTNVVLLITLVTSEFLCRVWKISMEKRSSVNLRHSTLPENTLSSVACRKSRDHIHHGYCSRYERDNDR